MSLREVQDTGTAGGTWHIYLLHKKKKKEKDTEKKKNLLYENEWMEWSPSGDHLSNEVKTLCDILSHFYTVHKHDRMHYRCTWLCAI